LPARAPHCHKCRCDAIVAETRHVNVGRWGADGLADGRWAAGSGRLDQGSTSIALKPLPQRSFHRPICGCSTQAVQQSSLHRTSTTCCGKHQVLDCAPPHQPPAASEWWPQHDAAAASAGGSTDQSRGPPEPSMTRVAKAPCTVPVKGSHARQSTTATLAKCTVTPWSM
jgi:hypothetical protein